MGVAALQRPPRVRGLMAVDSVVRLPCVVRVLDGVLGQERRRQRAATHSFGMRVGRERGLVHGDPNVRVRREDHLAVAVRPERTHGVLFVLLFAFPLETAADGEHQVEEPVLSG